MATIAGTGPATHLSAALGTGAPPIEIVETHPLETSLGLPDTKETRIVWLDLIEHTRTTLELEQFYVSTEPGHALEPILDAIGRAAARGVSVRLLIDAGMHRVYPQPADSLGGIPGIEVRTIDYRRLAGGVQHSKVLIADRATVFIGSQNFDWRALEHIHELGTLIRDDRVAHAVGSIFDIDWRAAADTTFVPPATSARTSARETRSEDSSPTIAIGLASGDTARVRLSASPPSMLPDAMDPDRARLVELIDGADHELVAQMLSYSVRSRGEVDSTLDRALRRAAARGVQVRLLVSDWQADSEERIRTVQSLAATSGIEVRLSVVAEHSGGYIPFARVEHCKFLVADSREVWIGTSNWGPDYFASTRNVGVTIEHSTLAGMVRRTFEKSWTAPLVRSVEPDSTYARRIHGEEPPDGHPLYHD
ncbi:MAG: phospholipase D-like domain-containing protein [Candidatus Eisenbacteria bacterium]